MTLLGSWGTSFGDGSEGGISPLLSALQQTATAPSAPQMAYAQAAPAPAPYSPQVGWGALTGDTAGISPLFQNAWTGSAGADMTAAATPVSSYRGVAFDPQAYLQANPDVAAARIDPWQHYQQFGINEGRAYTGVGGYTSQIGTPTATSTSNAPIAGTDVWAPTLSYIDPFTSQVMDTRALLAGSAWNPNGDGSPRTVSSYTPAQLQQYQQQILQAAQSVGADAGHLGITADDPSEFSLTRIGERLPNGGSYDPLWSDYLAAHPGGEYYNMRGSLDSNTFSHVLYQRQGDQLVPVARQSQYMGSDWDFFRPGVMAFAALVGGAYGLEGAGAFEGATGAAEAGAGTAGAAEAGAGLGAYTSPVYGGTLTSGTELGALEGAAGAGGAAGAAGGAAGSGGASAAEAFRASEIAAMNAGGPGAAGAAIAPSGVNLVNAGGVMSTGLGSGSSLLDTLTRMYQSNPLQTMQLVSSLVGRMRGSEDAGGAGGGAGPDQSGLTATRPAARRRTYVAPPAGYRPGVDPEHRYFV